MEQILCSFEKKFIKMIRMKHYSGQTEKSYLYHLRKFIQFKKPIHETRLSSQDINDYLVSLNDSDVSDSYFNQSINAIRFFFKYVLNKKIKDYLVVRPKKAHTQPIILDQIEIQGMFDACYNLKHLAIFSLLYSGSLRCGEIINLKIIDIDSISMVIRIRSGKGRKDRLVPLDKNCLDVLRQYYKKYKPQEFLFNGQFDVQYSKKSISEILKQLAFKANINKRVYPHLIRHSSITHLLENGIDIRTIQVVAGHKKIETTLGYTHISPKFISNVVTPFQNIRIPKQVNEKNILQLQTI